MWLKLTAATDNNKVLMNMNNIVGAMTYEERTVLFDVNNQQRHITESLAEIELMIMGSKPSAPDPRARNVIGKDPVVAEIEEQFRTAG